MKGEWGNEVIKDYEGNTLIYIGKMKNTSQVEDVLACSMISEAMDEKRKERILSAARVFTASHDLLEALQNLVQLKEWKDRNGKDEHYEKAQPIAWDAARAAISKALNQEV